MFFVGAAFALIGLLWLSERNERLRVEERLVDASRATTLARDEVALRDEELSLADDELVLPAEGAAPPVSIGADSQL